MNIAKPVATAAALLIAANSPALAEWSYSVENDDSGLEYASVGVSAPESGDACPRFRRRNANAGIFKPAIVILDRIGTLGERRRVCGDQ